jgi:3-(3-hydroxy-phenyl)propionate hydroxylase
VTAADVDVAIVGAGPAGATLANLLGCYGIKVVVLDREADVVEEPRAVGIDDEAIRTLQSFGAAERVLDDAVRNAPIRYYDSTGKVLAHVAPSERPYGWPRRNLFFQPNLERVLRASLAAYPSVTLATSTEAVGLEQSRDVVVLSTRHEDRTSTIRARYVVGADGGRSFVRDAVGVGLEGDTAPMKWLVVDVDHDTWDAPYSAVYTSPHRPCMTIPLPFGYRRFEFQILDDEDPDQMVRPEQVARLLARFYPAGNVPSVARARIYWHHSRTAETFQQGRVFLVGDAAHLQPPFFGQGMNSGIRDVTNLAWKLAFVVLGRAGPALLDTYDLERRGTARAMVAFATGIGRLYRPRSRATEVARNALFRGVQRVPGGRDYILQMKYKPIPRYTEGFVLTGTAGSDKRSLVGRAFPQPLVRRLDGQRALLDDVLGNRMALLLLTAGAAETIDREVLRRWLAIDGTVVEFHVPPAYRRVGQRDPTEREDLGSDGVTAVYDIEGGLRDLLLGQPRNETYLVRPDRYVAAVGPLADAENMMQRALSRLEGGR